MRNLLLMLLLFFSINSFSQFHKPITKGNMILSGGGTIQYQKDKFTDGASTSKTSHYFISFVPGFGYFIVDNLVLGINTSFFCNGTKNNKYYSVGIGPMIKYYFNNGIFLKADADYSILHNISTSAENEKYLSLMPGAGYAFFLNPKVSLEPCLCYDFDNIDYNSTNNHKINSLRLEIKFSIFL